MIQRCPTCARRLDLSRCQHSSYLRCSCGAWLLVSHRFGGRVLTRTTAPVVPGPLGVDVAALGVAIAERVAQRRR